MSVLPKLGPGDMFPEIKLQTTKGELVLPEAIGTPFAIVLIYRGHW